MNGRVFLKLAVFYSVTISCILLSTFLGNRAISVISEMKPIPRIHTMVIDPGHGGEDGGATSCTGKLESGYNLEISLRLRDLFELLGCKTLMIRTEDTAIYTQGTSLSQKKISDLKERVRIANQSQSNILLSIHQNTFPEPQYSGAQVFYNQAEGSRSLAEQLQAQFRYALNPGSHRKAKQGRGIYLMEKTTCTGILVECGFLTNPTEEARLSSAEYQKKIACVIASTVCSDLSGT